MRECQAFVAQLVVQQIEVMEFRLYASDVFTTFRTLTETEITK